MEVDGGVSGKAQILGMREKGGKVKAKLVDKTDGKALVERVGENVEPGSTVITDDFRAAIVKDEELILK